MSGDNQGASLLRPGIFIPFVLTAVIWGSTWLVIKDQLAPAPATWSVAWRFILATAAMFGVAAWSARKSGESLRLGPRDQALAVLIGFTQFCLNYNLIYVAEEYVTSGIVAVIFTLLLVPNALLARALFGQPISAAFLAGSAIAIIGVAMLLAHEARLADLSGMVWYGVGLCFAALFVVSFSNVLQSGGRAKQLPLYTLTAWSMFWGMAANIVIALAADGIPELPESPRYWAGLAYLALAGTVLTFPLYFKLLREMGAGRAAYNGVLIPIVAMALSTAFEGYDWSALAIGGSVLGLIGMMVALKGRQKSRG